jgi:hypothetical protein
MNSANAACGADRDGSRAEAIRLLEMARDLIE